MRTEYDLESADYFANPYPTYARMRRDDPIYRQPETGIWFVTRHHDVRALAADSRRFSSARVDQLFDGVSDSLAEQAETVRQFLTDWLVFLDPPVHAKIRKAVAKYFLPKNIDALKSYIQQSVDTTIDALPSGDSFDLVRNFCFPIPVQVVGHMLGVPAVDTDEFRQWSNAVFLIPGMVGDPDARVEAAYGGVLSLQDYFRQLIKEHRKQPADDLLGSLLEPDEDGSYLTDDQIISTSTLILLAGHETTTNLISNAIIMLTRNPAQLAALRATPELIDSAVEEFLRYDGVSGALGRIAMEDLTICDTPIASGEMVFGLPAAANRDETVFTEPDRFDITRKDNRHLGFGHGPHVCVGAALARTEIKIAINTLLARFANLQLASDELDWIPSHAIRSVSNLVVSV